MSMHTMSIQISMPWKWLGATALALLAGAAVAGDITVHDGYSFPTPAPGAPAAGFLLIDNMGKAPDRLLSVESPFASPVQIHQMSMDGGVMKMRALSKGLPVPAKGQLQLEPGGYHLMLFNPVQPVKVGDHIPLILHFAKAGPVPVALVARERDVPNAKP